MLDSRLIMSRAIVCCGLCLALPGIILAQSDFTQSGETNSRSLRKQLNGRWTLVEAVNQGRQLEPAQIKGTLVVIRHQTIVVLDPDEKELYKARFKLNTETKPQSIDMVTQMPNLPEKMAFGIVQMVDADGKKWKLCYGLPGADRPEKFASPEGSRNMLFVLTRVEQE